MNDKNNNVPDSWEQRIDQFAKIVGLTVETVNEAFAEKPFELTVDTPYVLEMLSDESVTPFGDLRKMFCDDRDVSLPKLRLGVKYLRGTKAQRTEATSKVDPYLYDLQSKYGFENKFEDLGAEELLPYYRADKNNKISKALKDMFGNKPVIAFKPDSKEIALEETLNYIVDLADGLPEEKAIEVDGELVRLHPIGAVPNKMLEEDPLFRGRPLKRGRSTANRVNWSEIPQEQRQFARVLLNQGGINAQNRIEVRQLIDDLKEGMDTIKGYYPEAYMAFKEASSSDNLPKLVLSLDTASKSNDPFGINRQY